MLKENTYTLYLSHKLLAIKSKVSMRSHYKLLMLQRQTELT